jgi:hypothetical protein
MIAAHSSRDEFSTFHILPPIGWESLVRGVGKVKIEVVQ